MPKNEQEVIEIKTLQDIKDKIKPEDRDAFFKDLRAWVEDDKAEDIKKMMEANLELLKALGIEAEAKRLETDTMHWINDGNVGLSRIDVKAEIQVDVTNKQE